ncbi:hypothetical protein BpHYR1_030498 [Brachionus plicatilis]|uniref:Uncharacterized protein n=1 Tax=Brachionus plicatilis TaxID=10195 RepID=A0A3M7R894_BRAPC|nr:hypothetical protein BpHYR1_030498 [Brachionus plicatilis]
MLGLRARLAMALARVPPPFADVTPDSAKMPVRAIDLALDSSWLSSSMSLTTTSSKLSTSDKDSVAFDLESVSIHSKSESWLVPRRLSREPLGSDFLPNERRPFFLFASIIVFFLPYFRFKSTLAGLSSISSLFLGRPGRRLSMESNVSGLVSSTPTRRRLGGPRRRFVSVGHCWAIESTELFRFCLVLIIGWSSISTLEHSCLKLLS